MNGERTSNPTPDGGRKHGGRAKPDWSRHPRVSRAQEGCLDNLNDRLPPPASFTRVLSEILGAEMTPVHATKAMKGSQFWRWGYPGASILALPWPYHWTFRRKGVRSDAYTPSFAGHVVVGSWTIAAEPLRWWIHAAEQTAYRGLCRERALRLSRGEDASGVPRWLCIRVLPPELSWLEPTVPDAHLLLAASPSEFPACDPRSNMA